MVKEAQLQEYEQYSHYYYLSVFICISINERRPHRFFAPQAACQHCPVPATVQAIYHSWQAAPPPSLVLHYAARLSDPYIIQRVSKPAVLLQKSVQQILRRKQRANDAASKIAAGSTLSLPIARYSHSIVQIHHKLLRLLEKIFILVWVAESRSVKSLTL